MDDEHFGPSRRHCPDEVADDPVAIFRVEADPVLDRDGQRDGIAHRFHAFGDQ